MPKFIRQIGWVLRDHMVPIVLLIMIFAFLVVFFWQRIFITISAGEAGVLWKRFAGGTVLEETYGEGIHVIWPWDRIYIYNVRLQEATDNVVTLAQNGLKIDIEILVRYYPNYEYLGYLHQQIGPNYLKVLVFPEVESHARTVISKYDPAEIYTSKRQEIQELIEEGVQKELLISVDDRYSDLSVVQAEDILIKKITLPATVRKAIEAKEEQKHLMLQYEFILQREEKERQRKEIEAQGIAKFQEIIKDGISDRYLRWKGIDATLSLSKSNNAKVVIIGAGDEGLPIILGNMGPPQNQSASGNQNNNATSQHGVVTLPGQITPMATMPDVSPPTETSGGTSIPDSDDQNSGDPATAPNRNAPPATTDQGGPGTQPAPATVPAAGR